MSSVIPAIDNSIDIKKIEVTTQSQSNIDVFYVNGGDAPLLKIELIFNAGSKFQPYPLVAATAVDLLKDGSKTNFGKDFKESVAHLGVYYGIEATKDFATLTFFVLEKHLNNLLEIVSDLLVNPALRKEEFDRLLKKGKNNFLIDSEKTSFLSRQKYVEEMYAGSEYGMVAHLDSYDKLKFDDCVRFIEDNFLNRGFQLWVSGCISNHAKSSIIGFVDTIKPTYPAKVLKAKMPTSKKGSFVIDHDGEQASVILGKLMPSVTHAKVHEIRIVNTLLGGYFGSRLMQNIREDKGWTYGIHSMIVDHENASSMVISAEVLKGKTDDVVAEVQKEILKLQNEPVPADELALLRNYLKGKLLKSFDGAFEQVERYLNVQAFGLDWSYYDHYIKVLESITPAEIVEIAKIYFDINDMTVVKVG